MRKIVVLAGIVAVAALAAVWSVSTYAKPKGGNKIEAAAVSAAVSPQEIMVRQGKNVPVEYWADPF